MTISEFSKIVAALKTVYTSPGFIPNEQALDMWYRLVGKNNDYQTISVAAQMYMTTGKFPPTPADILECASKLKAESSYLSEQEAWATVAKACTNGEWIEGGYSYQKNFDRLPKILQKAVGTPETLRNWSQVDMATMQTVVQSNFLRSYRAALEARKEIDKYPPKLQEMIRAAGAIEQQETVPELPTLGEIVGRLEQDNKNYPPEQCEGALGDWIAGKKERLSYGYDD